MRYSRAFRWFVALLLPLTLAWKLVGSVEGTEDAYNLKDKIIKLLAQPQFEIIVADDLLESIQSIRATRGACHMLVAKVSAYGWDRDYIRRRATNTADHVFIVFQGEIYSEQPTWRTTLIALWFRFIRKLGFGRHAPPVLAVAATAACDAEHLPWHEVNSDELPSSN